LADPSSARKGSPVANDQRKRSGGMDGKAALRLSYSEGTRFQCQFRAVNLRVQKLMNTKVHRTRENSKGKGYGADEKIQRQAGKEHSMGELEQENRSRGNADIGTGRQGMKKSAGRAAAQEAKV